MNGGEDNVDDEWGENEKRIENEWKNVKTRKDKGKMKRNITIGRREKTSTKGAEEDWEVEIT